MRRTLQLLTRILHSQHFIKCFLLERAKATIDLPEVVRAGHRFRPTTLLGYYYSVQVNFGFEKKKFATDLFQCKREIGDSDFGFNRDMRVLYRTYIGSHSGLGAMTGRSCYSSPSRRVVGSNFIRPYACAMPQLPLIDHPSRWSRRACLALTLLWLPSRRSPA